MKSHLLLTTIAAVVLVGCGNPEADRALLEAARGKISPSSFGYEENIEAVKKTLADGADVNAKDDNGWTPLHWAALSGHKEVSEYLITMGADVNAAETGSGMTPLHFAAAGDQKEIVELLLASGADVNAKDEPRTIKNGKRVQGSTPLDTANDASHPETADLLRKHGGKTGAWLDADKSIHDAARAGHIEAVKQHLDAGTDVNANLDRGYTALQLAAQGGHKEVAELLIANGADVNVKSFFGETPLDLAIFRKKTETADLLRKHGAKTGAWFKAEESIHIAAMAGHIEAVKKHLADGADVK